MKGSSVVECQTLSYVWLPTSLANADLKAYQGELSISEGCVLRGFRMVVPPQGHNVVLEVLHIAHPDCGKMKVLVRGYVWWLNMDIDIDGVTRSCNM